jgi:hypothetical protein
MGKLVTSENPIIFFSFLNSFFQLCRNHDSIYMWSMYTFPQNERRIVRRYKKVASSLSAQKKKIRKMHRATRNKFQWLNDQRKDRKAPPNNRVLHLSWSLDQGLRQ